MIKGLCSAVVFTSFFGAHSVTLAADCAATISTALTSTCSVPTTGLTIDSSGSVTASPSSSGGVVSNSQTSVVSNVTVSGTIQAGASNSTTFGFLTGANTSITTFTVSAGGSIIHDGGQFLKAALAVYGDIGTIDNSGTIRGANAALTNNNHGILSYGTIGTINNYGTIAGSSGSSITISGGSGSLTTLNNAQSDLTYSGKLPTYYNVIVTSLDYGKITSYSSTSTMTVGIASASTGVLATDYSAVITGVAASKIVNANQVVSYTSGGVTYRWMLSNLTAATTWDLILQQGPGPQQGPDATMTTLAMIANQNALRSLLSQRSSAIMSMMDYDCETFDAKGYCVSFRARYSAMDRQNEGAGAFTAAYRASEKFRIGAFLDYRASEKYNSGLKQGDTMPTVGAFAAYSHTGDATGLQAKASAAYNTGKVTVTRVGSVADNTEAGSGKTGLNSYAVGAELGWGFAVSPTMLATPYAGVRYSDVTRKGYTEGAVAGVSFPISYDAYYQRQTAATAGVRLTGMLTDKVGYQAALGGEYDLAHMANSYAGASAIPGLETFALANTGSSNRARVVASAGLYYQMDKTQRLTGSVGVRGQAYSSQPAITTLVGYQVAF